MANEDVESELAAPTTVLVVGWISSRIRYAMKIRKVAVDAIVRRSKASAHILTHFPSDVVLFNGSREPGLDIEVVRRIRNHDYWRDVPIILMSSNLAEQNIVYAFENGIDDYVDRSIVASELIARVKQFATI